MFLLGLFDLADEVAMVLEKQWDPLIQWHIPIDTSFEALPWKPQIWIYRTLVQRMHGAEEFDAEMRNQTFLNSKI